MGFMISERVVGEPLTPARAAWLAYVLTQYGVSKAGAEEFVGTQLVTSQTDRQRLLDVINRVVVQESRRPPGFRGKG